MSDKNVSDNDVPDRGSERPDLQKRIDRLERRLERERSARTAAEEIADRGMRELWLTNQALDERVAERTADLEATLAALEVASTSRERFLSVLSHEMRTPLNGVLGMLELLDRYTTGSQGAEYLQAAKESAEGLNELVGRLLDLVELTTGSMAPNLVSINADELARQIQTQWQVEALRTGHLVSFSSSIDDQVLKIDSSRTLQIINELLQNAVSYGVPGAIEVRLSTDNVNIVIEVQDSGPGITDERLELIFTHLHYGDMSSNRSTGGLGLGLSLSRRIAEALGGTLTIRTVAKSGVTATVAQLTMPAGLSIAADNRAA